MAYALVNSTGTQYSSGTSIVSSAFNLTSGNLLVVCATGDNNVDVSSISDTAGNTFTRAGTLVTVTNGSSNVIWSTIFYVLSATGNASNVVTVNMTGNPSSARTFTLQYSGTSGVALDVTGSGTTSNGTTITSGSFSVTNSNNVSIASISGDTDVTYTAGTNYGLEQSSGTHKAACEDRIGTTTGSQTASATASASEYISMAVAVFSTGGGGGGGGASKPTVDSGWPVSATLSNNAATSVSVSTPAGAGPNRLYVTCVTFRGAQDNIWTRDLSSALLSGMGLTWTVITSDEDAQSPNLVYAAWSTSPPSASTVTFTFDGANNTAAKSGVLAVYSFNGTANGSANVNNCFAAKAFDQEVSGNNAVCQTSFANIVGTSAIIGVLVHANGGSGLTIRTDCDNDAHLYDTNVGSDSIAFRRNTLAGGQVIVGVTNSIPYWRICACEILGWTQPAFAEMQGRRPWLTTSTARLGFVHTPVFTQPVIWNVFLGPERRLTRWDPEKSWVAYPVGPNSQWVIVPTEPVSPVQPDSFTRPAWNPEKTLPWQQPTLTNTQAVVIPTDPVPPSLPDRPAKTTVDLWWQLWRDFVARQPGLVLPPPPYFVGEIGPPNFMRPWWNPNRMWHAVPIGPNSQWVVVPGSTIPPALPVGYDRRPWNPDKTATVHPNPPAGFTVIRPGGYSTTNYVQYSNDLTQAAWTKTLGVTATFGFPFPNQGNTATRVVYDGSGAAGDFRIYTTGPYVPNPGPWTNSLWMRSSSPATVVLRDNFGTAGVTCNVNSTWQRFTITGTTVSSSAFLQLLVQSPGGSTAAWTIDMWGGQMEPGLVATDSLTTSGTAGLVAFRGRDVPPSAPERNVPERFWVQYLPGQGVTTPYAVLAASASTVTVNQPFSCKLSLFNPTGVPRWYVTRVTPAFVPEDTSGALGFPIVPGINSIPNKIEATFARGLLQLPTSGSLDMTIPVVAFQAGTITMTAYVGLWDSRDPFGILQDVIIVASPVSVVAKAVGA